jgi:nucleoside-diphosphate-sugar epimerase
VIFVTGMTGHSGNWFLKELENIKYSEEIVCSVRRNSNTENTDASTLRIRKVIGSIEDVSVLSKSMVGCDTVVHIAGIMFSDHVMEAAIAAGVKWIILVHTTGRFSKYRSASQEYIRIETDAVSKRNQLAVTVLRPTMIYGSLKDRNMIKLIQYIDKHKFFPVFGSGKNLMQPVHVKDLAEAYVQVLSNKHITLNKEYDLPGGEAISYLNLLKEVSKQLNRSVVFIKIPLSISLLFAKVYNCLFKKALISVEQVLRMQEDKAFDYRKATIDFNYQPVSFEEGIQLEISEYLKSRPVQNR